MHKSLISHLPENHNLRRILKFSNINSDFTSTTKDSTSKEKIAYIYALRARIGCELEGEHSIHSDRVTNIGLFSLWERLLPCLRQITIHNYSLFLGMELHL